MEFDIMQQLFWLIASLGGGFFAAAIGGNLSFVITGFAVLVGIGGSVALGGESSAGAGSIFSYIAFGPFTSPAIAFAGAAAATAYAAHKGYTENGRDIDTSLAGLGKPDVMIVGALFGALGYIIVTLYSYIPWLGTHQDSVAMTVVTQAIITRLVFGSNAFDPKGASLLTPHKYNTGPGGKFAPQDTPGDAWVRWQEKPAQFVPMGFIVGLLGAGAALMLAYTVPGVGGNAQAFGFAISAITIVFLVKGSTIYVTHQVTIIAGLAANLAYPLFRGVRPVAEKGLNQDMYKAVADGGLVGSVADNYGAAIGALLVGAVFGVIVSYICEYVGARLFCSRGTTHIDPPAVSIALTTWIVYVGAFGVQQLIAA